MITIADTMDFGRTAVWDLTKILANERSRVQQIVICTLARFGQAENLWIGAAIDNWKLAPQFSMFDEYKHHQMLAFPPLAAATMVGEGIILGGGDWPLAYRILMRRGVKKLRIIDWDKLVGKLVLEHIPAIAAWGVHQDPRVDFAEEADVAEFLPAAASDSADFIFGDLTDVADLNRIQPDFLKHTHRIMRSGGFVAFQAGAYSLAKERMAAMAAGYRDLLKAGYMRIWAWREYIESFSYEQLFLAGWKDARPSPDPLVANEFAELFNTDGDRGYYSPVIHRRAFTLDPEVEELFAKLRAPYR